MPGGHASGHLGDVARPGAGLRRRPAQARRRAFRDVLQNFLSGILLLLSEPFRVGDQIVYGSFEGTVEEIQTRATFLRTYDGRRIVIPNARLFTEPVLVNTAFSERRVECDIGIGVGDDVGRARQLMLETLRGLEGVLPEPPPEVLVTSLGDFSVKLRARWWTTPPRRKELLESQDQVLTALKQVLLENGIDLPFPTQQILLAATGEVRPAPPTRSGKRGVAPSRPLLFSVDV